VFSAITWYRDSVPGLRHDFRRREVAFEPEPGSAPNLTLSEPTRGCIRPTLGLLIRQPPVTPAWIATPPDALAATGAP
jgi:hypothetical protein